MEIHNSCLLDGNDYIIEIMDINNVVHSVYKGTRYINQYDKITDEGIYESLCFKNIKIIYCIPEKTREFIMNPAKLKRYSPEDRKREYDFYENRAFEIKITENITKFYEYETYGEKYMSEIAINERRLQYNNEIIEVVK
jgi:hypothetical protein